MSSISTPGACVCSLCTICNGPYTPYSASKDNQSRCNTQHICTVKCFPCLSTCWLPTLTLAVSPLQNSSLVLTSDTRTRDAHEPTGEPETLAGRKMHKMGDRAQQQRPEGLSEGKKGKGK
jgi:hypothetical protein